MPESRYRGANVSIAKDDGVTTLHFAAQYGHLAVTLDLVKAGADLAVRTSEGTARLDLAAMKGHAKAVAALIEAGATVWMVALGMGEHRCSLLRNMDIDDRRQTKSSHVGDEPMRCWP